MNGKRVGTLLMAMSLLMPLFSSCGSRLPETADPVMTLPPVAGGYDAPEDDSTLTGVRGVSLYLPTRDGQRLIARQAEISAVLGEDNIRSLITALFAAGTDDTVSALGGQAALVFSGVQPVEVSGNVCTINLDTSTLALEYDERYTVALALAATLSDATDIRYVNLLVADRALPFDVAGNLPAGSVTAQPGEDLPVLWDQMMARRTALGDDPAQVPLSATATLYFPLADGSGFAAEARNLTFTGQTPQLLTVGLLSALSSGAQVVSGAAQMPDLPALAGEPEVSDRPDGTRMITLRFQDGLESILDSLGVDMACFVACLNWTITTFVPQIGAVQIYVGGEPLRTVSGEAFGRVAFEDGVTRRAHFRDGLRDSAEVYLCRDGRLTRVLRYVLPSRAGKSETLLGLMLEGPTEAEAASGLTSPMPEGLEASDLLSTGIRDDTLLISLSARFADSLRGLDEEKQRLCCYAMVDTFCELMRVNRVRFFFDEETVDSLGTPFCWSGEFLLNHSITDGSQR